MIKAKTLLASRETVDLMRARKYSIKGEAIDSHYGVKLISAGHVLGARQLVAETDGGVFAYTGDFNSANSACVPGAEVPQCDVLYTEATFGSPEFAFPERSEVENDIGKWALQSQKSGITVLGGYALGKAQELVKILNNHGITPVVDESISRINEVYSKHGVKLDWLDSSSEEGLKELDGNFIAVVPMHKIRSNFAFQMSQAHSKKVFTAVATGWALTERYNSTKAFCLSDHCDFNSLMEFVEATGAKKVFTNYGEAIRFARELRKRGIDAHALEEQQKSLAVW